MRILFSKLTNDRHALEIVRADGTHERVELETKSLLTHDFLHLAVETEAGMRNGFWGTLAAGKTLAEMNDRSGKSLQEYLGPMASIEMLVGALSGSVKGVEAETLVTHIRGYMESSGQGSEMPDWLTPEFVVRVQERMRRLLGHWKATAFGASMEVEWLDGG